MQYQVKHLNPVRERLLWTLCVLGIISLAVIMYFVGREKSSFDFSNLNDQADYLTQQLENSREQERRLLEKNAFLKQTILTEQAAAETAKIELNNIQEKLVELKNELVFYESLLTPAEREPGIHIQQIKLEKVQGEEYKYELLLTQVRENDKFATGNATVSLYGVAELVDGEEVEGEVLAYFSVDFKFKFFQKIEGAVNVPGGALADQVQVILSPDGRRLKRVEKLYQWNELVGD